MRTAALSVIIVTAIAALLDCGSPKLSQADHEALNAAFGYKDTHLVTCGDSKFAYFLPPHSKTRIAIEFRGAMSACFSDKESQQLTEADRLNGIEWRGTFSFLCSTFRSHQNGQWSQWNNGTIFNVLFPKLDSQPMRKIHGTWEFGGDESAKLEPLSCDQVPDEKR